MTIEAQANSGSTWQFHLCGKFQDLRSRWTLVPPDVLIQWKSYSRMRSSTDVGVAFIGTSAVNRWKRNSGQRWIASKSNLDQEFSGFGAMSPESPSRAIELGDAWFLLINILPVLCCYPVYTLCTRKFR
ncbi:uncharacterized protein EI97DRAFT_287213 [Westerdykella ornata]|uniref:Uncharacterized protein n=1 Tax=Westerdykella ornata TaxID=318751 RepID=A0A6A6JLB8_WESOR|nr:uncharacterized protein EI97DRAFT_287213 [Westerdykella ornata]KAF2277302.1 hypothetical protein EI97DRAFT_287213 [Westerdykella ornata]